MNYRHAYHAGNFADVFKHVALMLMLDYLHKKDKPFFVLDTHAGLGRYELGSEEAGKTGEAADGIGRLWSADDLPEAVGKYLEIVRWFNRDGILKRYPGSPAIMRAKLRATDRMVANELHPEDVRMLRHVLATDDRIRVEQMDGYQLWKSLMPPPERRGLVLVDPPFEQPDEFERLLGTLQQALKRWATGIYALWYPIKDPAIPQAFYEQVRQEGIPVCMAMEFYRQPVTDPTALNGCGLLVVNPHWTLVEEMEAVMPYLIERLTDGQGRFEVMKISKES